MLCIINSRLFSLVKFHQPIGPAVLMANDSCRIDLNFWEGGRGGGEGPLTTATKRETEESHEKAM